MSLNVAIFSRNFFGAERRFFRIIESIDRDPSRKITVTLLINSSLFVAAQSFPWAVELLDTLTRTRRLAIVPDKVSHFGIAKRPHRLLTSVAAAGSFHAVLRSRPIAYARGIFGRQSGIEITSPDVADQVGLNVPYLILRRVTVFRSVSPAVDDRFQRNLVKHFGARRAALLASRSVCASSPYFDERPAHIRYEEKQNVIVSASRFTARKNVVLIAKALAEVLPQAPNWKALVLGKGEDEPEIRRILEPLIEEGRAHVGYETQMDKLMRASKVYMSMIDPDNYPSQSVLEALRFGNALILSDNGQSELFVGREGNGILIERNLVNLTNALLELVSDDERLKRMSDASVRHVAEAFSAKKHVDEFLQMHGLAPDRGNAATS